MSKRRNQSATNSLQIKNISPLTDGQNDLFDSFKEGFHNVLIGVAGTGKTFLSLYLSLNEIFGNNSKYKGAINKIVIIRSSVPSRDPGFLPGTAKEKIAIYEPPYKDMVSELMQRGDAWDILTQKGIISFTSTSFLRGMTIDDAFIIVDEFQNMTFQELDTVITRVGKNCKIFICGDIEQNDLFRSKYDTTGLPRFMKIIDNMDSFEIIEFGEEDIVRSGLVKEYILTKRKIERNYYDNTQTIQTY